MHNDEEALSVGLDIAPPAQPACSNPLTIRYQFVSNASAVFIISVGILVIVGWVLDIPVLKSVLPGFITMKVITAVSFILTGTSLWLLQYKRVTPTARKVAHLCALAAATFGALTLAEYFAGVNLGIDQMFIEEPAGTVFTVHPGRMAHVTAINFVLAGVSLMLLDVRRAHPVVEGLMFVEGFLSLASVIGYISAVPRFSEGLITFYAIAIPTAVTFVAVFIGVLFARPDSGWVAILASDTPGGALLRRTLPIAILLPPVVQMVVLRGEMANVYDPRLGSALHSVLMTVALMILLIMLAMLMDREDAERKKAEAAIVKSNLDLTLTMEELEKTQAILIHTEKLSALGTLSAGVAHEILNPLNIIGIIIQMLQSNPAFDREKENLKEIMVQINRATKIANNLRVYSRKETRKIKTINFNQLMDHMAELLEYDLRLDNITVIREFDPHLPGILGNEDDLAQVVLNQLTNARDVLVPQRRGTITLRTVAVEGGIEASICDDGPGIPEAIIGRIFDPFFTTKDAGKGTGLGLSVALGIMENQKGKITARNLEGGGACFTLFLPVNPK